VAGRGAEELVDGRGSPEEGEDKFSYSIQIKNLTNKLIRSNEIQSLRK
jgi:hypothetical protein